MSFWSTITKSIVPREENNIEEIGAGGSDKGQTALIISGVVVLVLIVTGAYLLSRK